jgi:integrase
MEGARRTDGWLGLSFRVEPRHLEGSIAKNYHARALKKANRDLDESKLPELKRLEPYVMRHTALTRLGVHCDVFTLATIAGHSSITMTLRYVHPQADAIERAFAKVGTRLGTIKKRGEYSLPKNQQKLV